MSITSGLLLVGLVTCVFYYIRRSVVTSIDQVPKVVTAQPIPILKDRDANRPDVDPDCRFFVRRWAAGGVCQSKRRLDGKTVIITGANSGMGKETAVNLAKRGARVILACRNDKRGEAAVAEVKQRSGSNAVLYRKLDLEELESIRKFANKIVEDDERVDILINNAGIWAHPHSKTVDGFETHFGVNYIGHFYLTNLLLGRLRASAPSRVVNVSSRAHIIGNIDLDEVDGKATRTRPYKKMIAYAESKLAVVLFTRELAKRLDGTGVTTYVVHPGCVRTRLQRMLSGTLIGYVYNAIYPFLCVLWKSPSEGAQTTIHCAVDERLDNVSGRYYVDCAESRLAACAEDKAVAQKLWEIMLQEHKHGMSCGIGFYATLAGLTVIGFRLMQKWTAGGVCRSKKRLDGKTVLITGANTGIGKETAVDMAQRGARVIVACRSAEKGEAAVAEVKERTGSADVVFRQMDLAELKSIKEFAQRILNEERRVDILINNAGVMVCPYGLTKDGFETQFGVNHLGHFYLTMLLLDRIKECAPSRIVNVSSVAYRIGGEINFDDIMSKKSYSETKAYSQSKLANVLFTRELARRLEGTGVTTYTLHPGAVRTELQRHAYNWPILGYVFRFLYPLFHITWKTPSQGAQTSIYCAVAEELEGISGKYYEDCTETKLDPRGEDDAVAKKLWEISEQYTGLA